MQVEINDHIISELRELLEVLIKVVEEYDTGQCWDTEQLIETWDSKFAEPDEEGDHEYHIHLPDFTLGVARKAVFLKEAMKIKFDHEIEISEPLPDDANSWTDQSNPWQGR